MALDGIASRTSDIAGNAMTASPTQFGTKSANRWMFDSAACTLPTLRACGTVSKFMNPGRSGRPLPPDLLLSVVMPVYNERTTVEDIIRRVLTVPIRIELVVV